MKVSCSLLVAVIGVTFSAVAQEIRPKPEDVKEFVADPFSTVSPGHFKDFRVTIEDFEDILQNYFRLEEEHWKDGYSHVAFGDRTGHVILNNGRTIKWMVRPGGLAWLEFPGGNRMFLANHNIHANSSAVFEKELDTLLSNASERVQIGPTWALPPETSDRNRFSYFVEHNKSRWNLKLDASKVIPGTVYEQTVKTEEGGKVSEYLVFGDNGEVNWWYDGRQDLFAEFRKPSVRKVCVPKLFLAMYDGESGWVGIGKEGEMPLGTGLGIGIEIQNNSTRYW